MNRSKLELICLFFSTFFIFFSFLSDSSFWFVFWADVAVLVLYPCFFCACHEQSYRVMGGFLVFILVNSVSSSFILFGLLNSSSYLFLFLLGYCIKFSVFPFLGWLYVVCRWSSWFFIFTLFSLLKLPWLLFVHLVSNQANFLFISMLGGLSLLFLSFFFWLYSFNWVSCWCHLMICSSILSLLIVISDLTSGMIVFFVGCLWCLCCVSYSYSYCDSGGNLYFYGFFDILFYIFSFISFPFSFGFIYKLLLSYYILSIGWFPLLCWVLYSFSEQYYLVVYLMWGTVGSCVNSLSWLRLC